MLRKIIVFALAFALMPLFLFAQKLGHINSQDLLNAMPEVATAQKQLQSAAADYQTQADKLRDEYNRRLKELITQKDTLLPAILEERQNSLTDLEKRLETFNQTAQTELQKEQQDLMQPILDKVKQAINEVGVENKFSYIFDTSAATVLFFSKETEDVLPLVKKKLGLQ
jgi:outer membrane protein